MDTTELIYKVLSEEATETERQELLNWIAQDPGNREEYEDIKLLWTYSSNEHRDDAYLAEGWLKVKSSYRKRARKRKRKKLLSCLAIFVVLAISMFLLWRLQESPKPVTFKDESLASVIEFIETEYDVDIDVQSPNILSCTVTATFHRVQTAAEIIASVADALNIDYKVLQNDQFLLVGETCQ